MAEKGWTAQMAAAAGIAAGTGAAQLGLGYGLGVVTWPAVAIDTNSAWLGSLGWATWIAASATVLGAVIAARLASRSGGPWRLMLSVSAAVGALVTVALIALPARASVRPDGHEPQTIAAGYAVVGIVLGLVVAYWAVGSRPVAANLIATAAWLWALAVAAVVVDLGWHRPTATYLSSWQFAGTGVGARYGTISWPSSGLTLLAAFVIGVIAVVPAVRRGHLGVGAASSGAVGPLLVAIAFFALAPRLSAALGPLESAYLIAPYAVLSGLAGSAMAVAVGRRLADRRARRRTPGPLPDTATQAGEPAAAEAGELPAAAEAGELPAAAEAGELPTTQAGELPTTQAGELPTTQAGEPPAARAGVARAGATQAAPAGEPPGRRAKVAPKSRAPLFTPPPGPESDLEPGTTGTPAPRVGPGGPTAMQTPPVAPDPIKPPPSAPPPVTPDRSTPLAPPVRSTVAPPPASPPIAKINPSGPTGRGQAQVGNGEGDRRPAPRRPSTRKATPPPAGND